jgi:hypothetical protein
MKTEFALLIMGILAVGGANAYEEYPVGPYGVPLGFVSYGLVSDNYENAWDLYEGDDKPAVAFVFSGSYAYAWPAQNLTEEGFVYDEVADEWYPTGATKAWSFTLTSATGSADTEAWRTRNVIDPTAAAEGSSLAISGFGNLGSGWTDTASFKYKDDNGTTSFEVEGGSSAGALIPQMSPYLDNVALASTKASASADGMDNAFVALIDYGTAYTDPFQSESLSFVKIDSISDWA